MIDDAQHDSTLVLWCTDLCSQLIHQLQRCPLPLRSLLFPKAPDGLNGEEEEVGTMTPPQRRDQW